mmetsp:Transcript_19447/g.39994  ORF Transcript_19447/g.39994 Transcript_19447/m.39994 type:complete len:216 (+) Transcript_19447:135-782(+)
MSNENTKIDDDNRCCSTRSGRRCMCLPYDDGLMIAAQILSIIAVLIAWIWWISFIIGIVGLILLQVIWCCRQSRAGLIASQVVSMIAAILSVLVGIFFLVARKDASWCVPFILLYDDDDDDWSDRSYDYCSEKAYAIVGFVGAALWFASAGCQIAFLKSGRYDKWEASLSESNKASSTAVEMGNVETPPATAGAIATLEAEECIPLEVLEKVDDA